jgi:cardiolipin synthase (CMP-forming)
MTAEVFTLANQLTLLRMLLIPAFVILTLYGEFGWALAVFAFAGLTDLLDGLAARTTGQKSELGAWLDPAADKLLLVTTFIVLTIPAIPLTNHLPLWLTVSVISRDIVIIGVVAIVNLAVGPRTFRPSIWGKMTTAALILTSVIVMYFNYRVERSVLVDVAIWISFALTALSAADYFLRLRLLINEPPPSAST